MDAIPRGWKDCKPCLGTGNVLVGTEAELLRAIEDVVRQFPEGRAGSSIFLCDRLEKHLVRTVVAQKDGDAAVRKLARKAFGDWEFVASGEASESPYHEWHSSFYVRFSVDRRDWALLFVDGSYRKLVAACELVPPWDETSVVRHLYDAYVAEPGAKYIEFTHKLGRFDIFGKAAVR